MSASGCRISRDRKKAAGRNWKSRQDILMIKRWVIGHNGFWEGEAICCHGSKNSHIDLLNMQLMDDIFGS